MAATAQMATFKAVGDWSAQMDVPISNALAAIVDMTGRSGRQACGMAMVYMARSARAMTPQSKRKRKTGSDRYGEYVVIDRTQSSGNSYKLHSWHETFGGFRYAFEAAKYIRNRGLAKRSWFWGLKGLRQSEDDGSAPIPNVVTLAEVLSRDGAGYILTNRLSYITKITPADLSDQVARKASNQIMAQAAKGLERRMGVEVPRLAAQRQKRAERKLQQAWRQAA